MCHVCSPVVVEFGLDVRGRLTFMGTNIMKNNYRHLPLLLLLSSPFFVHLIRTALAPQTCRCTPLHYAAGAGDLDLCKRLMEKGAKAGTWDFYQYSAVDYAKQSGATDCAAYLEEVSALGTTSNNVGKHPGFGASTSQKTNRNPPFSFLFFRCRSSLFCFQFDLLRRFLIIPF